MCCWSFRRDSARAVCGPQAATRVLVKEIRVCQEQAEPRSRRSSPRLEGFDYSQENYYVIGAEMSACGPRTGRALSLP